MGGPASSAADYICNRDGVSAEPAADDHFDQLPSGGRSGPARRKPIVVLNCGPAAIWQTLRRVRPQSEPRGCRHERRGAWTRFALQEPRVKASRGASLAEFEFALL